MRDILGTMSNQRLAVVTAVAGYNLIQNRLLPPQWYVPGNIIVAAGLVALARHDGCTWEELGLEWDKAGDGLRLGTIVASTVSGGAWLGASPPGVARHLRDERAADQGLGDILYHTLFRFPLGTALFEEVAFRGVIEAMWAHEGATDTEAAVAAAVLFGIWHLVPTHDALGGNPLGGGLRSRTARFGAVVVGAAATGVASLGFSWLRRRSKSLAAPWLAHTAISVVGYLAGVRAWHRLSDR